MRHTPLHDRHVAYGAKMVDFSGWALPVQYHGILDEHQHTREAVSIFDCSHMGEFQIQGEAGMAAFNALVCTDVFAIKPGRARYGAMLNESGGIIDDVITFRVAESSLFVVTNAGPLAKVSARIRTDNPDAEDLSDALAKIDVQGPEARKIIEEVGLTDALPLKYFGCTWTQWNGVDVLASRTGYTGELGYELFVPNDAAARLWDALMDIPGVEPAGLGARDTLRLEAGYSLSGQDFDETRTPLEARLDPFIDWDSGFAGKAALEALRGAGNYPLLTALETPRRSAPRHGFDVFADGAPAGRVTSGSYAPSLGHGIGLAYLERPYTAPGQNLTAGPRALPVVTTKLPFYKHGTCRNG